MTAHGPSEVTVILVPVLEIAKIMSRYKNSILRYNPRSYLEFKEQRTNEGIRRSVTEIETGEFAILNNGITIVSDETYVNERVGSKNKAQVEIVNPQIINGGQTAFTLAGIYEENADCAKDKYLAGKEVVVRIITLPQIDEDAKKKLILSISSATNSQTSVGAVDRAASNDENRYLAELVFKKTGLLYEPKRGEYLGAIKSSYISKDDIIERTLFTRMIHLANSRYSLALERKLMKNTGGIIPEIKDDTVIERFAEIFEIYTQSAGKFRSQAADVTISNLVFSYFALKLRDRMRQDGLSDWLPRVISQAQNLFPDFETWGREIAPEFLKMKKVRGSDELKQYFDTGRWKRSSRFPRDVDAYMSLLALDQPE